ncbi:NAD-dependent glyceraldehyde-3-phosphate dehydrogenase [Alkalibacterium sp. AK22]|uniref:type I glyceraldehyde-3-phosphate dehydrogenase n=1 Tax=Alkalibacterium sp. AK22 TaxID=1229520 RepID=UPI0004509AA0|nr:type I glyceraldehyde-3-phosphate dehydrogenase [Alkalibacterium sp. AK22]EXJ22670.1 NAD-dependent glyceraldehyde-3-phosphate dehydrogenase [Alkalibacterium sp. AK22]
MSVKVAINGFGRIGRLALRRILEIDTELEVVAINDLTSNEDLAYLLKYDTAQGRFPHDVDVKGDALVVGGKEIKSFAEKDASKLPWGDLDIDIVLECTGFYVSKEASQAHVDAGAKRVLISAPAKGDLKTIVYGVNHDILESDDQIVSAASCTTNCLAPMVNVLNTEYGISRGLMSTIHAYTATQAMQDAPGGRKNRAGAANAIPASTGAAKAVGKVIPEVNGLIDGTAVRIPTITGSMVELYSVLKKDVTVEEVNAAMEKASSSAYLYTEDEIVSSDVIGVPAGSIFDATQTKIMDSEDGQLVKTVAWYDNEYGFTGNMVSTLEYFAGL